MDNDNQRYIFCLTNEIGVEKENRIKKEDAQHLLKQFNINFLVLGFGMDNNSKVSFEELTNVTNEGKVILNATKENIKEIFLNISNYTFQSTPLILETF